jgi:phosphate:Na+ symporter
VPGHVLLLNIAGGVALLLWATRMVRTGVMRAYGSDLRHFLGRSTNNRLSACAMGLAVTGVLQSSTATALLAVSFASRGLVKIGPSLAIMLGADVGSTLVVQVLSFDISWLSPALILIGVVSFLAGPSVQWRHVGRLLIGLGLMLLALTLVVGASESLRESTTLQYVMQPLANDPILALLLAAVITWVAHSSVAIVLLVMSLTVVGVVPLTLGFALVLGANVGSGIIPLALTASGGAMARRIPLGNLLFRAAGAILVLPLIDLLAPYVALLGTEPGRQIANFHTAFNFALALVFLPLTTVVGNALVKFLPDTGGEGGAIKPRYLDPDVINTPTVAIACAIREVLRMADTVESMLRGVIEVFRSDDSKLLETVSKMDDEIDRLHEAIKLYLTEVTRNPLSAEDSRRCVDLISFTTNLEHIGDIIDKNLLDLAGKKIRNKLSFSEEGWQELTAMHDRALHQMQLAMSVFVSQDIETARQLLREKERFRELEMEGGQKHLARLRSGQIESIETSALHLDILRDLKRINSHLTSVAYPILDASGELRSSRLKDAPRHEPENPPKKPDAPAAAQK